MRTRPFLPLIAGLFLAQMVLIASSVKHDLGNPVAVDRASDSSVYVLSADRYIRRFDISGEQITLKGQFPVTGTPVDFTYSRSGQVESLFVCSINFGKGVISRYSTDGNLMKSWWLWHPCGGVDYDPDLQILYFGTTDTREIYRIDLKTDTSPESLSQLPQMQKMGPIALDSTGKVLYIGDIAGGVLFEFDIANRSVRTLISGLGAVAALYADPNSQALYIVDSVARTVLLTKLGPPPQGQQASTQAKSQKPTQKGKFANIPTQVVTHAPELRSPSGVVPLDNGRYLVSDYGANALFLVSANGKVSSRFP